MYAKNMLALPRYVHVQGYLGSLPGVSCTICINLTFSIEFKKNFYVHVSGIKSRKALQQPLKQIGGHHNRRELLCISVKLHCKYNANNVSTTVVLSLTRSANTVEQEKRSSFKFYKIAL
jgi:hypothetical protein